MTAGTWNFQVELGETFNPVLTFQSEYRTVNDAVMTASSTSLVSNKALFSVADVGKSVTVQAAGTARGPLVSTISSYTNATTVVLAATATFGVSNERLDIYSPIDLTSFSALMTIYDRVGNTVISLSTGNGRIALGGTSGSITLLIAATDTATLPVGSLVYDLAVTSGSGIVTKLIRGSFDVLGQAVD